MKQLLLLDNYDSFTYNLKDYFLQLGLQVSVFRNDEISLEDIKTMNPAGIVLSPGPGRPEEAGIMPDLISNFYLSTPILGICLGHQAIGLHFGEEVVRGAVPMHGKTSRIYHNGHSLFAGLPERFEVMRYHSLLMERLEHSDLLPIAWTASNELMALAHVALPIAGYQFHPESILTEHGLALLRNWLVWSGIL